MPYEILSITLTYSKCDSILTYQNEGLWTVLEHCLNQMGDEEKGYRLALVECQRKEVQTER